jgi:hypothetical protein
VIELAAHERAALAQFVSRQSPLRDAIVKIFDFTATQNRMLCAMHMATVPRNFEVASDFASRALQCDEMWTLFEHAVHVEQDSSDEPTVREQQEE